MNTHLDRRQFTAAVASTMTAACLKGRVVAQSPVTSSAAHPFKLKYMLASCMYGHIYLGDILPEVKKTGSTAIDLWPRKHGSQREQLDAIGEERFLEMIAQYDVSVGCLSRYDLGKAGLESELQAELRLAGRLGCDCVVTSAYGPRDLTGSELKTAVRKFVEKMKPTIEVAQSNAVRLTIENHGNNLIESPDSLKWLAEFAPSSHLAIALAPYHLEQDPEMIRELIESLGPAISLFYAWEHGMGCMTKLPKEQELLQMPGRGTLDFTPILAGLKKINFNGWTEIFMHPVPRGIPILDTEAMVTQEINRSRSYLTSTL